MLPAFHTDGRWPNYPDKLQSSTHELSELMTKPSSTACSIICFFLFSGFTHPHLASLTGRRSKNLVDTPQHTCRLD